MNRNLALWLTLFPLMTNGEVGILLPYHTVPSSNISSNCTFWTCYDVSDTGSCFCTVNIYEPSTWEEADQTCVNEGGYLASIKTLDEELLMEDMVNKYIEYTEIDPSLPDLNIGYSIRSVWIGLQQTGCYSNKGHVFYWHDNCSQEIVDAQQLQQTIGDAWAKRNNHSRLNFPLYDFSFDCSIPYVFAYTTGRRSPWSNFAPGKPVARYFGAFCRKDLNPCGSNPCKNRGICTNNINCFTCLCKTSYTGKLCEYDIVESRSNCKWVCLNDNVGSCFCVHNSFSSELTWNLAKQVCEIDWAYLAKIETLEQMDLLEVLVRRNVYPENYNPTTDFPPPLFNYTNRQGAAIGLVQIDFGANETYQWKRICPSKILTRAEILSQFSARTYDPVIFKTDYVPFGRDANLSCTACPFYFTTSSTSGPFNTIEGPDDKLNPSVKGIACRKDMNPCGSNPCLQTEFCTNLLNISCFQCTPKPIAAIAGGNEQAFRSYLETTSNSIFRNGFPGDPKLLIAHLIDTKYDPKTYPGSQTGSGTIVGTSIYVQNMRQEVQEAKNVLLLQAELLVSLIWFDHRLAFRSVFGNATFFALNSPKDKRSVWSPLLHFPFGSATVPSVLQENSAILINSDGLVVYNLRLMTHITCSRELVKYPFDTQMCSTAICLFGPSPDNLNLIWTEPTPFKPHEGGPIIGPVQFDQNIRLDQFLLTSHQLSHSTTFCGWTEICLTVGMSVERISSATLIDCLVPSIMLAVMSWLSLFIDLSQIGGRLAMQTVLFLSSIKITADNKKAGLDVEYLKFIDKWLLFITFTTAAVIVETAVIGTAVFYTSTDTNVEKNYYRDFLFLLIFPLLFIMCISVLFSSTF